LIDGKAFVPKNRSILQGPLIQCNYIYTAGGYNFTVGGSNEDNNIVKDVIIRTDALAIAEGQSIKLTSYNVVGKADGDYTIINAPSYLYYYYTNETLTGQLTITKLDPVKQIVSGTFYFNVLNITGDTVKITNGRFDMLYTK
jgi:hypothetical protein